jgi:predicted phosphodiesterase
VLISTSSIIHTAFAQSTDFVVLPYLQIGNNPTIGSTATEELCWITKDSGAWAVEINSITEKDNWLHAETVKSKPISCLPNEHLSLSSCKLTGLKPGLKFRYRILKDNNVVFSASSVSRKSADQSCRIAIFGDTGAATTAEKKISFQCYSAKPDLIIIPGDIVYSFGRFSEYLEKFFPTFNTDYLSQDQGAPLLRSVISVGILGNHDIALSRNSYADLYTYADALAYFFLWSEPLNGPFHRLTDNNIPLLKGSSTAKSDFLKAAGKRYPSMANYSFDYGNTHWTVLDANFYMDWTNPELRKWVADDLANSNAKWKFVSFHQPGFSCDKEHNKEQRMRLLSDVFEKGHVDIVFSGHAHLYQRTYPMYFKPNNSATVSTTKTEGTIPGAYTIDHNYDGKSNTKPNGVVYIISGAGGAPLYGRVNEPHDEFIKDFPFVAKVEDTTHSLTLLDTSENQLTCTQMSENGNVIDQFKITK